MGELREGARTSAEIFRVEAEAEAERKRRCDESKHQLVNRCSTCGNLGSLELIEGVMRCVDCDEVVAAASKLPGFGRR